MRRLALGDRLRTIAITAMATSVGWLIFGGGLMDRVGNLAVVRKVNPATSSSDMSKPTDASPRESSDGRNSSVGRAQVRAATGTYLVPVSGVRPDQLVDTFSQARGGGTRVHDAIDIMAPQGTPVVAAAGGIVEKLFTSNAGGLTIYVRSPDRRVITYYAHLDAYVRGIAEGQQVRAGQQLGTVGATGNADPSAPHLHFAILETAPDAEWWEPAYPVNPYPVLSGRSS